MPRRTYVHPVLGRLLIVDEAGYTTIYHRTGKVLNYHPTPTKEPEPMSRVAATFEEVTSYTVPGDTYELTCADCKEDPYKTTQRIVCEWKVYAPGSPQNGKTIRFDRMPTGGTWDDGQEVVPGKLANLISKARVPWTCLKCNPQPTDDTDRVAEIITGTGDDGREKGALYCPDCNEKAKISFDTNKVKSCMVRGVVEIEKGSDDKDYNKIKRYLPSERA